MKADYSQLPDEDAAQAIYARIRAIDDTSKTSYAAVGLMLVEAKKRLLWQYITDSDTGFPCRSFTRFVRIAAPYSYSSAFAAYAEVESLLPDINADDLAQMSSGNLHTLTNLSTAVRSDPKVLEAARTKKPSDFVQHIQNEHPGQHIAVSQWIRMPATPEQAAEIQEAAEIAIRMGDALSLTDWVFQRAIEYKQSVEDRERMRTYSEVVH